MSAILLIKCNVASYDPWRTSFERSAALRRDHEATREEIFCSPEDMTSILVVEHFDSVESAQSFVVNPVMTESLQAGGVIGAPHFTIAATI